MSAVSSLDVSSVVTGIGNQLPVVEAIGMALLGAYVVVLAVGFIRRMISGDEAGIYDGMGDDDLLAEAHDYAIDEALDEGLPFSDSGTGEQWGGESDDADADPAGDAQHAHLVSVLGYDPEADISQEQWEADMDRNGF